MSSPRAPGTPVRAPRPTPSTPGSTARTQCSADQADFLLIKIHTAKCSICDKRNATDEMRRCKGCTWQICRPCQLEREAQNRSLAHGNLMSATPTSTVRRRVLHKIGAPKLSDPEAEKALASVKEEEREAPSTPPKKEAHMGAATNVKGQAQEVTPPSSSERKKLYRQAKTQKSMAEPEVSDDEGLELRDPDSPLGVTGSKRRFADKTLSPDTIRESPRKRPRMERLEQQEQQERTRKKAPNPHPPESEMSPEELDALRFKPYTNVDEMRGIRPSQHPTLMQEFYGIKMPEYEGGQSILHRNMPTPLSRDVRIPANVARNGLPRKTGEEFMEEVRDKVRAKLAERFAWPVPAPANNIALTEPTAQELANLKDLAVAEWRNLCRDKNLSYKDLDQGQQMDVHTAMRDTARKFGHAVVQAMPPAFKSMVVGGLGLTLDSITDAQKQEVIRLVQNSASCKLKEFADEGNLLASNAGHRPEHAEISRESAERSTL
ncbi:hypothetical protein N0V90_004128 [Kalmusia sp. IMI 367209]|nr:hypothetical protein N0V90_004128 [Kalmusia sp. IMI 367209]